MQNIFFDIGLMIILATVAAYFVRVLRQPPLLGYIVAGILIGPAAFGLITNTEVIANLSEIGIAFFLFIIGLEMDLRKIRCLGVTASVVGLVQVSLISVSGFFIANALLGFSATTALYVGLALAFSSTMIVVKLLSDKRELDSLHGRIVVGVLIVQDVISILALTILPRLESSLLVVAESLLKGIGLLALVFLTSRFALPGLFRAVSKSKEMLFMCSVAWCFALALLSYMLGYSVAIGSFLAGLSLASLAYNLEIISMVKSLRDFFSTIFFVSLGMQITLSTGMLIAPLIALSLLVIIGKPLVVIILMGLFGYSKRASFLSGIAIAQISEFSLIIIALGKSLGHITQEVVSVVAIVAVATITISTYFIQYDNQIYLRLSRFLSVFEGLSKKARRTEYVPAAFKPDVVLCGHNRIGYSVLKKLCAMKKRFLVVDYNPEVIKRLVNQGVPCIYGDLGDLEVIERLNIKDAEIVISTVPNLIDNLLLIKKTKEVNKKAVVISTASQIDDALRLYDEGADYVVLPHFLGGEHVSILLEDFAKDFSKVIETRLRHINELHHRKSLGHEHPLHNMV